MGNSKKIVRPLVFLHVLAISTCLAKNITIVGTGYVGLITGVGLAQVGNEVTCFDIDETKIKKLQKNIVPIFEPDIAQALLDNHKNLSFTSDCQEAIDSADVIMIAVGTPMSKKGKAYLRALKSVITSIAKCSTKNKIVCIKSTVPPGTNDAMQELLNERAAPGVSFTIVSNPEFLREGSALQDFFECNPIVLGSHSQEALEIMQEVYKPLVENGTPLITTNPVTAETIKYAWNAFSATRITFVNELAHFCDAMGADIHDVVEGMSYSTKLLPTKMLRPGPGIGGSCLPKDTNALVKITDAHDVDLSIVKAVIEANKNLKLKVIEKLYGLLNNDVKNKTVAVLGLSFKANTDDIRYSPAIVALQKFIKDGAVVKAYDPQAMQNMQTLIPEVTYAASWQHAVEHADAVLILTEWQEFKDIDLLEMKKIMKQPIIMDARNIFAPDVLHRLGFSYANLGRKI